MQSLVSNNDSKKGAYNIIFENKVFEIKIVKKRAYVTPVVLSVALH